MKRFVTSDSHGAYLALFQCLERCRFDMEKDQLIFLGDVVDGWSETKESIDLLLSINNLVYILGNHDQWALDYYTGKMNRETMAGQNLPDLWLLQGGQATVKSYGTNTLMPQQHLDLLQHASPYYVTEDNILFVHAGLSPSKPLEETATETLIWDRDFVMHYYSLFATNQPFIIDKYKEIYIGHTPTVFFSTAYTKPLQMGNITLMDTGAAYSGSLSIMDIDSKEVWQSDQVMTLYPYQEGRNGISWNQLNPESN